MVRLFRIVHHTALPCKHWVILIMIFPSLFAVLSKALNSVEVGAFPAPKLSITIPLALQ